MGLKKAKSLKEKAAEKEAAEKKEQEAAEKEAAEKEAKESEGEDDEDDTSGAPDDASEDVEIIKKMLKDVLGDDHGMDEAGMESMEGLGKEAYQAHQEMGKEKEEAMKCAGEAVKLAHHMAQKQKQNESEDKGDDAGQDTKAAPGDGKGKPAVGKKKVSDDEDDDEAESVKESAKEKALAKKLLETEGRLAALESKTKKAEVTEYVDQKLKESGQSSAFTKRFREAVGEIKSKKQFDEAWKVFMEGAKNQREETLDWSAISEKSTATEGGGTKKTSKTLSFSECAE